MSTSLPQDHDVRQWVVDDQAHNIFLDAGAGCGKTHTLVERYMAMLHRGVRVSEIVAVTFTNKAAREMKSRVREACRRKAGAETEPAARREWLKRAQEMDAAPICTIHVFCSTLLRRHALHIDLDPGFLVLDNITQNQLLKRSVRETLLRRLDEGAQTAAMSVFHLGLANCQKALAMLIAKRAERPEVFDPPTAQQLLTDWKSKQDRMDAEVCRAISRNELFQENMATLKQYPADDENHDLETMRRELLGHGATVNDETQPVSARLAALHSICELPSASRKKGGWHDETAKEKVKDAYADTKNKSGKLGEQIRKLLAFTCPDDDYGQAAAELTAALYTEAQACLQEYERHKAEMSALDFEDLQIRAWELLCESEAAREDCAKRYRHLMVDEFQDTNRLQKELLWLAAGGATDGTLPPPGRLFVVGDAKQSIYRFRDADVRVFNTTKNEFAQKGACKRLEVTFRATPQVVDLHNRIFLHPNVMGPPEHTVHDFEAAYETLKAYRTVEADPPCTAILVRSPLADAADDAATPSAAELRAAEARAIADWLVNAHGTLAIHRRGGEGSEESAETMKWSDVALLFRSMADVQIYERELRARLIPYHVTAGQGFFVRQEVYDLLGFLTVLENRRDEVALAGIVRSPFFGFSDSMLVVLKCNPEGYPAQTLLHQRLRKVATAENPKDAFSGAEDLTDDEIARIRFAWNTLDELFQLKNRLPLSSLLLEIIERTGYTASLAALPNGDRMIANVWRLIEQARNFEALGNYSLRDFIDVMHDMVLSEERMSEAPVEGEASDVVKISTIHSAKGLEWPVVIVPDINRRTINRAESWRYHTDYGIVAAPKDESGEQKWPPIGAFLQHLENIESMAESRRTLYVALTRCMDHLVISAGEMGDGAKKSSLSWLGWLKKAFGDDLEKLAGADRRILAMQDVPDTTAGSLQADEKTAPVVDIAAVSTRVLPIAIATASLERFTVTELTHYRNCPHAYRLRYLENMPEAAGDISKLAQLEELTALERGEVIHRALQIIGSAGEAALDEALKIALYPYNAPQGEHDKLKKTIKWFLETETYDEIIRAAGRLRSEMTILFQLDECIIEGKIDALAETDAGCHLLDYKTGADTESEKQHDALFQVGLYRAGLMQQDHQVVSSRIVYLDAQTELIVNEDDANKALTGAQDAIRNIRDGVFKPCSPDLCSGCRLRWACMAAPE